MGVLAIAKGGQIGGFWLDVEEVAEDEVVVIKWWKSGSGKHDACENNVLMLGGSAGVGPLILCSMNWKAIVVFFIKVGPSSFISGGGSSQSQCVATTDKGMDNYFYGSVGAKFDESITWEYLGAFCLEFGIWVWMPFASFTHFISHLNSGLGRLCATFLWIDVDFLWQSKFFGRHLNSIACKCVILVVISLVVRAALLPTITFSGSGGIEQKSLVLLHNRSLSVNSDLGIRKDKFLEVPQIVWGLNNQKIALARACLTARMLNRTLLMPSLSASLFYKEVDLLKPISFDKVFQFDKFNSLCAGFVRLGRYSDLFNQTGVFELHKGSGRKWTIERDLDQLRQHTEDPIDGYEVIRIVGKNPFLWHDHWPVEDYAKVFECLVLVDEITKEADKVVTKIREKVMELRSNTKPVQDGANSEGSTLQLVPYVAVHMRIEIDWMIHCKKLEQRLNISQICSSKEEIIERVGNIVGLKTPTVVYLAVADSLLEDSSILNGWKEGLLPLEKKKLGVDGIYKKYPYLIQSAIDYEVCLRADVFVGNSFSTFSSLIALERTQKMIKMGVTSSCGMHVRWPSYAYNILGESKGPRSWMTNMSDSSLQAISYGSNDISC
ncbi:o-fucosyltransferase 23 [Quercus suber]|uniref:O-fucosyltransferase family protein n=1 Tax=Quercus suber TaxID=58331 RepID=A0AAW0JT73_QUESU